MMVILKGGPFDGLVVEATQGRSIVIDMDDDRVARYRPSRTPGIYSFRGTDEIIARLPRRRGARMTWRLLFALLAAFTAFHLALAIEAHAGTNAKAPAKPYVAPLAPPVVCTMANRMDIFVDEDDILWACECEAMKTGHICRWQVIGGVDAVRIRRKITLHLLPPRFWFVARLRIVRPL